MSGALEKIKQLFRRAERVAEEESEGAEPASTPPSTGWGDPERETSTNAQVQGASDEPWPGND